MKLKRQIGVLYRTCFERRKTGKVEIPGKSKGRKFSTNARPFIEETAARWISFYWVLLGVVEYMTSRAGLSRIMGRHFTGLSDKMGDDSKRGRKLSQNSLTSFMNDPVSFLRRPKVIQISGSHCILCIIITLSLLKPCHKLPFLLTSFLLRFVPVLREVL